MAGYDYQSLASEHPIFPSATENLLCISYENYQDNSWPQRKITFKWKFQGKELFWNSVIQIFALFSSFHSSVVVWERSCIVTSWIILSLLGILIHRMFFWGWSGQPLTWTPNGWARISMGTSPAQPHLMTSPARKKLGAKLGDTCGKLWGHQMSNAGRFYYEQKY